MTGQPSLWDQTGGKVDHARQQRSGTETHRPRTLRSHPATPRPL